MRPVSYPIFPDKPLWVGMTPSNLSETEMGYHIGGLIGICGPVWGDGVNMKAYAQVIVASGAILS